MYLDCLLEIKGTLGIYLGPVANNPYSGKWE